MEEIKSIIDDLGNDALESSIKIAGAAVVSDSGEIIYQTSNFDLTNQTHIIQNLINGDQSFVLNDLKFSVVATTNDGIIATNDMGMGHGIFVPFQGGVLVAYAMPQADTTQVLAFLKTYAIKLDGKV